MFRGENVVWCLTWSLVAASCTSSECQSGAAETSGVKTDQDEFDEMNYQEFTSASLGDGQLRYDHETKDMET